MLTCLPLQAFAAGVSLSLSGVSNQTVDGEFDAVVNLNTGGNLVCVVEFNLSYPADQLELRSAPIPGSAFGYVPTAESGTAGILHYLLSSLGCTTSNVAVLTIPFRAKATGSGNLTFSNYRSLGGDNGDQTFSVSASVASITVSAASGTGTTPTGTSTTKKSTTKKSTTTTPATTIAPATTTTTPATTTPAATTNQTEATTSAVSEPAAETPRTNSSTKLLILGAIGVAITGIVIGLQYLSHRKKLLNPIPQDFMTERQEKRDELAVDNVTDNIPAETNESFVEQNQNVVDSPKPVGTLSGWDEILGTEEEEKPVSSENISQNQNISQNETIKTENINPPQNPEPPTNNLPPQYLKPQAIPNQPEQIPTPASNFLPPAQNVAPTENQNKIINTN